MCHHVRVDLRQAAVEAEEEADEEAEERHEEPVSVPPAPA